MKKKFFLCLLLLTGISNALISNPFFNNCPDINWQVVPTGENHTIVIPMDSNPTYNGEPLPANTLIGVFNEAGELWGFSTWTGTNDIAITAYGDDGDTLGFMNAERFAWRIETPDGIISETVAVTYLEDAIFVSDSTYETDGISGIASLAATDGVFVAEPIAAFSTVVDGGVAMFNNTSAEAFLYEWDFGDGNSSTEPQPSHEYNSAGDYEVCLIATNDCFSDTLCQTVSIMDASGCNDVTDGGMIEANQTICPDSPDPAPLTNVTLPAGGTGNLQYIWIFTTDNPASGSAAWHIIFGSNSESYDPPALSTTTWFRRCVRAEGCPQFVQESNIVEITFSDNCEENFNCDDFEVEFFTENADCENLGNVELIISGGTPPYHQEWADENTNPNQLTPTDYQLNISDSGICETEIQFSIEENCMHFLSFDVNLTENGEAALSWEVMDEAEDGFYVIEQSKDGIDFNIKNSMLSEVNTPNQIAKYNALETLLIGSNFFRIRYVDGVGNSTYSDINTLVFKPDGTPDVITYPNPFQEQFTLDFLEPLAEPNTEVVVKNSFGQIVETIQVQRGKIRQVIDLSEYGTGVFWISWTQGKRNHSIKILKQE